MSKKLEIHCVKVEKVQSSSSVQGTVKGSGITIKGSGASSVSGQTNTVHTSTITANGKVYVLKEKNKVYPFSEDHVMVFLCKRDDKTGTFEIISLLNKTNDTRSVDKPKDELIAYWIITVICTLTVVLSPVILVTIYHQMKVYPPMKEGYENLLSLEGVNDKKSMEQALTGFSGKIVISGYE